MHEVGSGVGVCHLLAGYAPDWAPIGVFKMLVVGLAFFSSVFLICRLRLSMNNHISLYPLFTQIAAITFLVNIILWILEPFAMKTSYDIVFKAINIGTLSAQWWIQFSLTIFMSQKDTESTCIKKTIIITSVITFIVTIPPVITFIFEKDTDLGVVFVEVMISVFFAVYFVLTFTKYRPRPAARLWCLFQLVAHIVFTFCYSFFEIYTDRDFTRCVYVSSDAFYYILYVPILWYTLSKDSKYWRKEGALLRIQDSSWDESLKNHEEGIFRIGSGSIKLGNRIGAGAFSDVYRAVWRDSEVAVKRLKILPDDSDMRENLLKEARFLSRLKHKNILEIVGICEEMEYLSLVTIFMHRGSLAHLIHSNRSESVQLANNWDLKLKILRDTAHGMNFLHTSQPVIIHRDLKSQNLLLDDDYTTKIADFGVSRVKNSTTIMSQVGTPHYMAPEIIQGHEYSEKADVWAFGVIVWELLTMQLPFDGLDPMRVVASVGFEGKTLEIPKDAPEEIANLIGRCWHKVPQRRPSFAEIIIILDNLQLVNHNNDILLIN